jgi:hypothetical protein
MKLSKFINSKIEERAKLGKEITDLQAILFEFPDAEVKTDRWKRKRISSEAVNSKCEDYDIYHDCGCCHDSPLIVSPFIQTKHCKIFSSPEQIIIGHKKEWGYGEIPDLGWEEKLKEYGIPEKIIEKIKLHFGKNLPKDEYDEEDYEYTDPRNDSE